ncbi:MAG: ribosome maturation factor RimP [Lysobacterales bacterium]
MSGWRVKTSRLTELLTPVIEALGLVCVGVEYAQGVRGSLLRVYIDAPGRAVAIEDCERVSREISAALDVEDPINERYTLEVSSPGLDRPLFNLAQFGQFVGERAKLSVNLPVNGRRRFQGTIVRVEADSVVIDQDGVEVAIGHDNIEKARLAPLFEPAQPGPRSPSRGRPAGKPRRSAPSV